MSHSLSDSRHGLTASGLTIARSGTRILRDVSMTLSKGSVAWIDGPSGAGKSTLLLALARLIPVEEGELALNGTVASLLKATTWRRRVLFVPHPPTPLAETVGEDLTVAFRLREHRATQGPPWSVLKEELERLGLGQLPGERPTRELSQGQLARIVLLRALLLQPDVLLLDEPTANLDPDSEQRIARRVEAFCADGGAALIAAHATPWPTVTRHYRIVSDQIEGVRP